MRFGIPHIAILALLAACEPTWQSSVPVTRGGAQGSRCGGSITVSTGDTVFALARRCNVSVRDLIETNRLDAPFTLAPGQVLRLPGGGNEYVVQRGDTLTGVARRHKVDFQTLARTNGKSAPYTIFVGEKLRLPGSYPETRAASAPAPRTEPSKTVVVTSPVSGKPAATPAPVPAETRHVAFQPQASLPPEPPPLAGKGFVWPIRGEVVSDFGPLAKGQHNDGINIAAPRGTPIQAAENGVVAYAGNELKGFGNLLLIKHDDGWMTAYAHADQLLVQKGETVKRGQRIATVGATGNVTSPQLHFEIRKGTEAVNPAEHLAGPAISLVAD